MQTSHAQRVRDAYAGQMWPDEQVAVFRRTETLFPTRRVKRGATVRPLPTADHALAHFTCQIAGQPVDLYDYTSRNRVAGLLVMHRGAVVLERYELGIDADTRWMSMSMAKSISATLVGMAIAEGAIGGLDDRLVDHLPELRGGGYEDVSVAQLLRMTSGVRWNEDHTNPQSERRAMLELQLQQTPGAIVEFMSRLPKDAPAGQRWNYSTGETHMVGALLRAATGRWLADYLTDKLWRPLGMEQDAEWWLESPDGLEVAGSGLTATLRDYARFGTLLMRNGILDGQPLLPKGWVDQAGAGLTADGVTVPYGLMWWPVPSPAGAPGGVFSARGIFGQRIYVDRARDVLAVMLCARSKPMHTEAYDDNLFFNALAAHLAEARA